MTTEMFVKLVMSMISIASVLITAFVLPYIKAKITAEQMDQLAYYVTVAVRCAEQLFTPAQWEQKKNYVYDYIMHIVNTKLHINLTEQDIDIIIEGIVNEVKKGGTAIDN